MKQILIIFTIIFVMSCASGGGAQVGQKAGGDAAQAAKGVSLDAAIGDFSEYIAGRRLPENALTSAFVLNTPVQSIGNYIADKLTELLLNNTGLRSIIYGEVEAMPDAYHLSLRVVDERTGELKGSRGYELLGTDPVLVNLVNPDISVQSLIERQSILTPFDGAQNSFELKVSTKKSVFYDRENMQISLIASKDCYFVLYHLGVDNNIQVIYPNAFEHGRNTLKAGVPRSIPEDASYMLHAPYGEERILVYASEQPIDIPAEQYEARPVTRSVMDSMMEKSSSRGLAAAPRDATAQVSYSILPK